MKLFLRFTAVAAAMAALPLWVAAATVYGTPKHEMRAAWVATVWQLDWPTTTITTTGNETQIAAQQTEMTTLLDSLASNNMNAINIQVRSRCDAMYKSSYEPWSSDLVGTRGLDPGYDPLEFIVEECHKRGIECNAWVNPYRYESVSYQWDTDDPNNYRATHPDWIMDVSGAAILNPGNEEVIQRITDVCKEIISNYDVDGLIFDDYFYLSGTPESADSALYNAYVREGGTLELADWRRDNVNRMVRSVYEMIQTVKPWVRFGMSPAGVACSSSTVAAQYGVTTCPGSDWQYSDIYSDPVNWVYNQILDYISPQIYWTIGHTTDYSKVAPWWSQVAYQFNRHFYSSHSITSLTTSSTAPAYDGDEDPLATEDGGRSSISTKAVGTNGAEYSEYSDQIEINRTSSYDDCPGSVFYSAKYMYRKGYTGSTESFAHYLKRTTYKYKATVPPMNWKTATDPGAITNLKRDGNSLSWDSIGNVRYTIYAVPNDVPDSTFNYDVEYLLGVSYCCDYDIDELYQVGYKYAVCPFDRYGNEYSPTFYAETTTSALSAPTLLSPEDGAQVIDPFTLSWSAVDSATVYFVQLSTSADFSDLATTVRVTGTTAESDDFIDYLDNEVKTYWRVRACASGYEDGVSDYRSFTPQILSVLYPADEAEDINPVFTATWNLSDGTTQALLEIAEDKKFESVVFSASSATGSVDVPAYNLSCLTTYYVRVSIGDSYSRTNEFTTAALTASVPTFVCPATDGATVYADQYLEVEGDVAAHSITLEVSNSETTWARTRYSESLGEFTYTTSVPASEIKTSGSLLADGTTYWARARATYYDSDGDLNYTDYCTPVSFVYSSSNSGVAGVLTAQSVKLVTGAEPYVTVSLESTANVVVKDVTALGLETVVYEGSMASGQIPLNSLPAGAHIITVSVDGASRSFKLLK